MYGESSIREVELSSGKVLREKRMATQDFGEGLVKVGDRCASGMTPVRHPTNGQCPETFACVASVSFRLGTSLARSLHCLLFGTSLHFTA